MKILKDVNLSQLTSFSGTNTIFNDERYNGIIVKFLINYN